MPPGETEHMETMISLDWRLIAQARKLLELVTDIMFCNDLAKLRLGV